MVSETTHTLASASFLNDDAVRNTAEKRRDSSSDSAVSLNDDGVEVKRRGSIGDSAFALNDNGFEVKRKSGISDASFALNDNGFEVKRKSSISDASFSLNDDGVRNNEETRRGSIGENTYVVLRHGDRSDCAWDPSHDWAAEWMSSDPPLSADGIQRAKSAGESLRNDIDMKSLQKVVVISSPYLRCVQTAAEICRSFQKCSIFIDNQIGEIWHPEVVGESTDKRPGIQAEDWCQKHGIQIIGDHLGSWPAWLEEKSKAQTRYALRFLQYTQLSQTGSTFVLVTHAEGVGSMLRSLPKYGSRRVQGVEYCGGFIARRISCVPASLLGSCIRDSWDVKIQGISVKTKSKDTNPLKEKSFLSNEVVDSQNGAGHEFPLHSKGKTVDIILGAVSTGYWGPASSKNALLETDFFDSLQNSSEHPGPEPDSPVENTPDSPKSAHQLQSKIRKFDSSPAGAMLFAKTHVGDRPAKIRVRTTSQESHNLNPADSTDAYLVRWLQWLRWLKTANQVQKLFCANWSKAPTTTECPISPVATSNSGLLLRRRKSSSTSPKNHQSAAHTTKGLSRQSSCGSESEESTASKEQEQPQEQMQLKQQMIATSEAYEQAHGTSAKRLHTLVVLQRKMPFMFVWACVMLALGCRMKSRSFQTRVRAVACLIPLWVYHKCQLRHAKDDFAEGVSKTNVSLNVPAVTCASCDLLHM